MISAFESFSSFTLSFWVLSSSLKTLNTSYVLLLSLNFSSLAWSSPLHSISIHATANLIFPLEQLSNKQFKLHTSKNQLTSPKVKYTPLTCLFFWGGGKKSGTLWHRFKNLQIVPQIVPCLPSFFSCTPPANPVCYILENLTPKFPLLSNSNVTTLVQTIITSCPANCMNLCNRSLFLFLPLLFSK